MKAVTKIIFLMRTMKNSLAKVHIVFCALFPAGSIQTCPVRKIEYSLFRNRFARKELLF